MEFEPYVKIKNYPLGNEKADENWMVIDHIAQLLGIANTAVKDEAVYLSALYRKRVKYRNTFITGAAAYFYAARHLGVIFSLPSYTRTLGINRNKFFRVYSDMIKTLNLPHIPPIEPYRFAYKGYLHLFGNEREAREAMDISKDLAKKFEGTSPLTIAGYAIYHEATIRGHSISLYKISEELGITTMALTNFIKRIRKTSSQDLLNLQQ